MQQCLCNSYLIIFIRRCKQRCCIQDQRAVAREMKTKTPRCACGCFKLSCVSYQYLCRFLCLRWSFCRIHLSGLSVYVVELMRVKECFVCVLGGSCFPFIQLFNSVLCSNIYTFLKRANASWGVLLPQILCGSTDISWDTFVLCSTYLISYSFRNGHFHKNECKLVGVLVCFPWAVM